MKNYSKIFKLLMLALIVISFALLVVGFIVDFEANDGKMTDTLLYWAYIMVGITLVSVIVFGLWASIKSNPKVLKKLGIGVVGAVALCVIAYVLAAGNPAMGMLEQPSASTLKLTDTILNLTYIVGAAAIVAIIFGEIRMALTNKKK